MPEWMVDVVVKVEVRPRKPIFAGVVAEAEGTTEQLRLQVMEFVGQTGLLRILTR